MDDSSSPIPKGTPETSSSPTPTPYPEPAPAPDAPAVSPGSSAGDQEPKRKPSRSRSKSTRRKTTRRRSSSRSSKVDAGDAPKPRSGSSSPAPPGITVDPALVRKVLEQGGETSHYFGCEVLGLDPRANPDLFALTAKELDDLAPPLARIASRHAAAARLVEASDEILVATIIGKASLRNIIDARWAIDQANAKLPADELEQQREGGDRGFTDETRDVSSQRG